MRGEDGTGSGENKKKRGEGKRMGGERERGLFLRWRDLRRGDGGGEVWKRKLRRKKRKKNW